MSSSNFALAPLDAEADADLPNVTYFTIEAHNDCILSPLEEARNFSIHIGLPDRPDRRHAWRFNDLEDTLKALTVLEQIYPHAALWLSTAQIQTELLGDSVWEAVVFAQAEIEPYDDDREWNRVASMIVRADADEIPIRRLIKDWLMGLDELPTATRNILGHL